MLLLLALACAPSTEDLYGWWANLDEEETWRVLHFYEQPLPAGMSRGDYEIFMYADGADAERVQQGVYVVEEGVLVTRPYDAADPSLVGGRFDNEILGFSKRELTLGTSDGSARTYEAVDELP